VRPTINNYITEEAFSLTGINQAQLQNAKSIDEVLVEMGDAIKKLAKISNK
jgi:inhibitor of KinA sporulation pathway (predicted exonuclease)